MNKNTIEKNIEKFCKTPTLEVYSTLPEFIQKFLIDISFQSLSQKTGDYKKSQDILITTKQIKNIWGYNIYCGPQVEDNFYKFCTQGVAIFPILQKKEIPHYQKLFDRTLEEFPEYKNPQEDTLYVLGGFSALGNPSSFHNSFVRNLRLRCWDRVMPFFKKYIETYIDSDLQKNYNLQMLWDRMMKRNKGKSPVAESWHRDVIPKELILPDDEIYGGWINLDSHDQYFSCIPGSHLGVSLYNIPSGFDTLQKRLENIFKKKEKNPELRKKKIRDIFHMITQEKKIFKIPPGNMIIFPQYILHEVVSKKASYNMKRLFLGWRLTLSKKSIYKYHDELIENQAVIPLPSGQIPPMYSSNHQSCYLGIPVVKKLNENARKKFDFNKWARTLSNKYKLLYPTQRMKNLYQRIDDKKYNKKSTLAKMTEEYLSQPNINRSFDKKKFIQNKNLIINIGTMKANPQDASSLTTLIKWSEDTFPTRLLKKRNYKNMKDQTYLSIPRYMPSLKKMKLPTYPPYTSEEKKIYKPYPVSS